MASGAPPSGELVPGACRGVADAAAGRLARFGRTAGQPRGRRGDGDAGCSSRSPPEASCCAARRPIERAERADRGCRGGQRLSDRRPRRAVAPHDGGLRGLPAAARAEGAAVRRLRVVLPDGDAAHPRRRDVDGPVPGEAHHPAGAVAGGGGAGDWRRPPRSPRRARDRRRVRRARRGVQQHGRGTGGEPARRSSGPRSISSASTSKAKGRRRYIETILERIATGVVSIDARASSAR